jgi:PAS domain S-box-containing protein
MYNPTRPEDIGIGRLFESTRDAIIVAEAESGRIVLWNPAATKIFGYSSSEALALQVDALVPEYLRARHHAGMECYRKTGQGPYIDSGVPLDLPALRKGGEEIRIEMTLNPIGPLEDRATGGPLVLAIIRDVTERKQIEEEIRQLSEDLEERVAERTRQLEAERSRFEAVLQQMYAGLVIAEAPSGKILLSNERAQQIRRCPLPQGIGAEEYGQYDDRFRGFHPDGRAYRPEDWPLARSVRTGEVVVEEDIDVVRGDGSPGVILVNSSPIYDEAGRIVAGVALFLDITERKRAQEGLRELNEELEERVRERTAKLEETSIILDTALKNLAEGVLLVNLREQVLFANPTARAVLGIEGEELPIKLADLWRRVDGLEDFNLPQAVARCAREQECIEAVLNNGKSFVRLDLRPLPQFGGMQGGALVVMEDLSAEQRLEANQQRFLANASHELKTPLTAILGSAELLLTEGELTEVQRRFLKHIASEAERMQRLSETLLRLARTGYDFREPEMQLGELEVVQEAIERMKPLAEKGDITLLLEDRGGYACADPEWLEQALLILLSNAIKYSEPGGRVWVSVERATITVKDEGAGIREADLPHVFERFYRGEVSRAGSGLGLPLCKGLIERMGGTLSISSQQGVGTTATIELREV